MGSVLLTMLKPEAFHCVSYGPVIIIGSLGTGISAIFGYTTYKGERQDVTCTIAGEPTVEVKDVSSCCYEEHSGKHVSLFAIASVLSVLLVVKSLSYYWYVRARVANGIPGPGQYLFTVFQSYMAQLLARIVILVIAVIVQLAKFRPTGFSCTNCTPHSKGNTTSGPLQEYDCKIPDLFPSKVTAGYLLLSVNLLGFIVSVWETLYLYRDSIFRDDESFFRLHLHIKVKENEGPRAPLLQQQDSGSYGIHPAGTSRPVPPIQPIWPWLFLDRDADFQTVLGEISKYIEALPGWQSLGLELGVDIPELSDFMARSSAASYSRRYPGNVYPMLLRWSKETDPSEYWRLGQVLRHMGQQYLADLYEKELRRLDLPLPLED